MKVKGSAVQTIPLFVKAKFGEDGYNNWIASLPEPSKKLFTSHLLASDWYPLNETLVQPTLKVCEVFYNGKLSGAEELGQYNAEHALKGIYKLFIKLGSVDFIVGKAGSIMSTFYENSLMSVVDKKDHQLVLRIAKFDQPHEIVELRIKGWIMKALQLSGAKNVAIAIPRSMTKGAPETDFVITWA